MAHSFHAPIIGHPSGQYAGFMAGKRNEEKDERVKIPLDPETALRALLAVDPDAEPAGDQPAGREQERDNRKNSGK